MVIFMSVLVVVVVLVPFTTCVELDIIDCGVDINPEVSVGDVEISTYPWIGIFYYTYRGEIDETRAVTTVILIQSEFVIASAADIGPIPKLNFRKKSFVLLGENWPITGRRVRNYVLHPEYGETYNTLALIQLKDPVRSEKIKPACFPPETLKNPIFYVMKFQEDYNDLKKQVIPVAHVPSKLCRDFYMKANLYSKMMRPPHVACAVSLTDDNPCVWDAGAALVSRDVWGRWLLLGVGARGPGCGAPSRFLDMASYAGWVKNSLQRFQRVTISRINNHKFVLRSAARAGEQIAKPGTTFAYERYGACDAEEKINCLYRELIRLRTDNMQFQTMTYNMTIAETVEYTCLTLELINASATSQMSIRHYCDRVNFKKPCYFYKGSIFMISVEIIYSDACLFEMYAWGFRKDMRLLDTQEWKWEEGTYYEDFTNAAVEDRGHYQMTDFGFEPLDQKMWVPDYDVWSTSEYVNKTTSTTYHQKRKPTEDTTPYAPTTQSTTPTTKRTFRRRTTTSGDMYFLWGIPRLNKTKLDKEFDDRDQHFFYRKNTTTWW